MLSNVDLPDPELPKARIRLFHAERTASTARMTSRPGDIPGHTLSLMNIGAVGMVERLNCIRNGGAEVTRFYGSLENE